MRDQYAGDVSDVLKFALLRSLAGADRKLGVGWYYAPGDDGRPDGRHLEWREELAWQQLDEGLHAALGSLTERSIVALESAAIWPQGVLFHQEPIPHRAERAAWASRMREALKDANLVFLDPDNGIGNSSIKHATMSELRMLRSPDRAIVFISFPGRSMPHDQLVQRLHGQLAVETGVQNIVTLRTNVSVPKSAGSRQVVQRQRWFTILDADAVLFERAKNLAVALRRIPRVSVKLDNMPQLSRD